ncbi:uncharacterized protein LOC122718533 [Apis laboriosa]|uniref:uncharacterized protein LOC102672343 n=1 Tax=Apis dorsata TaxID=7462 RepID=UPI0003DF5198|nr:uncharacterized protein LOC102672343 [Apis dorsata]XP_043799571.1 uncharacterized protein LOC122718533 [Apis laboriosa]
MRGMRVALFVAILATIVEISRAESTRQSLQCKNIARDVIINSCKGPRMKRSPEKFDTSNADQIVKATISDVMEENPVGMEIFEPEGSYYVQARMPLHHGSYGYGLMPSRFGGIGQNYQSTNFHQSELITPGLEFMDTQYTGMSGGMYGSSLPMRPKYLIRSVKSDDLLGFNLSPEELEELHNEIGDRMPRNSKNLNKRIFQQIAMKCCPNARLCYDNPRIIPCMGY